MGDPAPDGKTKSFFCALGPPLTRTRRRGPTRKASKHADGLGVPRRHSEVEGKGGRTLQDGEGTKMGGSAHRSQHDGKKDRARRFLSPGKNAGLEPDPKWEKAPVTLARIHREGDEGGLRKSDPCR